MALERNYIERQTCSGFTPKSSGTPTNDAAAPEKLSSSSKKRETLSLKGLPPTCAVERRRRGLRRQGRLPIKLVPKAWQAFQHGMDTAIIADLLWTTEAQVYNSLSDERERRQGRAG